MRAPGRSAARPAGTRRLGAAGRLFRLARGKCFRRSERHVTGVVDKDVDPARFEASRRPLNTPFRLTAMIRPNVSSSAARRRRHHAGIVDQHVDATKGVLRGIEQRGAGEAQSQASPRFDAAADVCRTDADRPVGHDRDTDGRRRRCIWLRRRAGGPSAAHRPGSSAVLTFLAPPERRPPRAALATRHDRRAVRRRVGSRSMSIVSS